MGDVSTTSEDSHVGVWSAESIQVFVCTSIAFYNSLELFVLILTTFKKWNWKSLYFDSILIASLGIIPYNIGLLLEYFRVTIFWLAMTFSSVGWVMLITGQSLVLYSRLNLIFTNDYASRWILKMVKWMIIIDAIVFHISITVIQYGTRYGGHQIQFRKAIFYGERTQMTAFCIQEIIISGLYLWKTRELLKVISKQNPRRIILGLFLINVLLILFDIGLLALTYRNLFILERAWKPLVYSVKLKLEFVILGKLVDLVQSKSQRLSTTMTAVNDFVVTDATGSTAAHSAQMLAPARSHDKRPKWIAELEESGGSSHVEDNNVYVQRSTPDFEGSRGWNS
jgi:hypothetical protein